jgi:phosphatidylserine/phosphatidylglycerophosphate/cardiolipin synthase-like enzyme
MKICLLILVVFLIGCSELELIGEFAEEIGPVINTVVKDTGSIEVYFCPRDNCEDKLVDFLSEASDYIHCAVYDLDLPKLSELLIEKSSSIDVKVIIDEDNQEEFSADFVMVDSGYGLMHNKFCIIDDSKLFMGSFNPTVNGAEKNNNNVLLIESSVLASNYEKAFDNLWNGERATASSPKIELSGQRVENYFCPKDDCGDEVKEELYQAEESIYFMTFSFTHEGIGNVLLIKNDEDVLVQGIFENRGSGSEYSKFGVLDYQGIPVRKDGNSYTMHHKVFIIDEKTVITGSFNPSKNADTANDENILIIEDAELAARFLEEFDLVWAEAKTI